MKKLIFLTVAIATVIRLSAQIDVTSSGNVGIGTASPSALLHVLKTGVSSSADMVKITGAFDGSNLGSALTLKAIYHSGYGTDYDFAVGQWNGSGYTNLSLLNLNANGNVGIGTANPLSKLHVQGIGRFGLNDSGTNNIGGILVASGTGAGGARQYWVGASDPTSQNNNMFEISDYDGTTNYPLVTIYGMHAGSAGGNVGIGTTTPGYKLEVAGPVRATSFISNSTTYADFVFKPGYQLASLSETEAAIQRDGHLPGIPSEAEAKEHGIDLSAMQVRLLQKVEELTLHLISHEKQLAQLQQENADLRRELAGLKDR